MREGFANCNSKFHCICHLAVDFSHLLLLECIHNIISSYYKVGKDINDVFINTTVAVHVSGSNILADVEC